MKVPEEISDDGGASVVLRRIPRQLHVLSSYLCIYSYTHPQNPDDHNYLIWLEKPWFAWYVENIDKASCFKAESEDSVDEDARP